MRKKKLSKTDKLAKRVKNSLAATERQLLYDAVHRHAIVRTKPEFKDKPTATVVLQDPKTLNFLSHDPKVLEGMHAAATGGDGVANTTLIHRVTEAEALKLANPQNYMPAGLLGTGK
jgi:hypothetical protein